MKSLQPPSGLVFKNRHDAGRRLAAELDHRGFHVSVVLGLTRGGVPVATAVALALKAPMDILVVRKLRTPFQTELGFGAVCADGAKVIRKSMVDGFQIPAEYVANELEKRQQEARQQEDLYRGGEPPLRLEGEAVAIVDDGIATGSTTEAAIASVYQRKARVVIVAAPVASPSACRGLSTGAEHVCCIGAPPDFSSIAQFYLDFDAVPDDDVRRYLAEMRALARPDASKGS